LPPTNNRLIAAVIKAVAAGLEVLSRELGNKEGIANSLNSLGDLADNEGDYVKARTLYEESLALARELGNKVGIPASLARLGAVALGAGQVDRAAKLLGAADGLLQSIGARLIGADRLSYERAVASARALLRVEAFGKAWQEGQAMNIEQAIKYGLERTPKG
jgi:hypothetical protein